MNNLTPRAQQTLDLARRVAQILNHNVADAEHLFLGLLKLRQGVAWNVLSKGDGFDFDDLWDKIKGRIVLEAPDVLAGNITYTTRVREVLNLAKEEMYALNHSYLGTEHILLGLLSVGGIVSEILGEIWGLDNLRNEILLELNPPDYDPLAEHTQSQKAEAEKIVRSMVDSARALCILHGLEFQSFL